MRSYQSNPKFLKTKVANSQSPIQKKRLLEFATQNLKTDKSMQGLSLKNDFNPQRSSSSTKVIDFRREIERRYQHSSPNHHYRFPRKGSPEYSSDRSLDSLKDVWEYDLHTQDFKASVLLEKRRSSFGWRETDASRYSEELSVIQSYPKREYLNDSIQHSVKKKVEGKCLTSRDHYKVTDILENMTCDSSTKKSLKMITSKSQKNFGGNNIKPKNVQKEKEEDSHSRCDCKTETRTFKLSDFDMPAKTINLNVNVNMNMNVDIKGIQSDRIKQKPNIPPLTNAECFINCNFYPTMYTTKSTKDLKLNIPKSPTYFYNLYKDNGPKTTREESKKKGVSNVLTSSCSTIDKSILSLKPSHYTHKADTGKVNNSQKIKLMKAKQERTNPPEESSFSSSFQHFEGSKTSRENSKNKTHAKTTNLYQRMQQDLLQKLRSSANKKSSTITDSPLYKFAAIPLTARAMGSQETPISIKITARSPKTFQEPADLKNIKKTSHSKEKAAPIGFKEMTNKIKQKEDGPKKHLELRPSGPKGEHKVNIGYIAGHNAKKEKPKFKLNFQEIGQKVGPFSDRFCQSSDRSDLKNRSLAEYFK